ncbi:MAG: DNA-3-methyladenine glycosylase family protein [Acidimicrobiia bacterium]
MPPLWVRQPSFDTLVRLILEQQVSLASANAAFRKLETRTGEVTPEAVLASTDAELRADGFSRQKAGYVRGVGELILSGDFDPEALASIPEPGAALLAVRGIGPWTAACFQLFSLGSTDIWPTGDRALYVSMGRNLYEGVVPSKDDADNLAAEWSPHRSTAARMLWHDYLGGRSYVPSPDAGFSM